MKWFFFETVRFGTFFRNGGENTSETCKQTASTFKQQCNDKHINAESSSSSP